MCFRRTVLAADFVLIVCDMLLLTAMSMSASADVHLRMIVRVCAVSRQACRSQQHRDAFVVPFLADLVCREPCFCRVSVSRGGCRLEQSYHTCTILMRLLACHCPVSIAPRICLFSVLILMFANNSSPTCSGVLLCNDPCTCHQVPHACTQVTVTASDCQLCIAPTAGLVPLMSSGDLVKCASGSEAALVVWSLRKRCMCVHQLGGETGSHVQEGEGPACGPACLAPMRCDVLRFPHIPRAGYHVCGAPEHL